MTTDFRIDPCDLEPIIKQTIEAVLRRLNEERPTTAEVLALSARDAAKSLSVCEKTLWSWTAPRGPIPCVKMGTRVLYDPRDLLAFIDRQKGGDE